MGMTFHQGSVFTVGLLVAASMALGMFGLPVVLLVAIVFGAESFRQWLAHRAVHLQAGLDREERETGVVAQLSKRLDRFEADAEKFRIDIKTLVANGPRR